MHRKVKLPFYDFTYFNQFKALALLCPKKNVILGIEFKLFKRRIDAVFNMLLSADTLFYLFCGAWKKLRRYNDIFSACHVSQRAPYILLGRSKLIGNGSVKKVDAVVKSIFLSKNTDVPPL